MRSDLTILAIYDKMAGRFALAINENNKGINPLVVLPLTFAASNKEWPLGAHNGSPENVVPIKRYSIGSCPTKLALILEKNVI